MTTERAYKAAILVLVMATCVFAGLYTTSHIRLRVAKAAMVHSTTTLTKARTLLSEVFAQPVDSLDRFSTPVSVTAYTARAEECDSTPEVTADNTPSRVGVIAMSHDLFRDHHLTFGDRVMVEVGGKNLGVFEIRDSMNHRWTNRVDIMHGNLAAAKLFGHNEDGRLIWVR